MIGDDSFLTRCVNCVDLKWEKLFQEDFEYSAFDQLSLRHILFGRAILFIIALFFFINRLFAPWTPEGFWKYLTNVSYTFYLIYFIIALGISFSAFRRETISVADDNTQPTPFRKFLWIFWELVFTNALTVTILFWVLEYPVSTDPLTVWSFGAHGVNAGVVVIELFFFNRVKFIGSHIFLVIFLNILYVAFSYIWYAVTNTFIYSSQDPDVAGVMAYITMPLGLVLMMIMFFIGYGLAKLRNYFAGYIPEEYTRRVEHSVFSKPATLELSESVGFGPSIIENSDPQDPEASTEK